MEINKLAAGVHRSAAARRRWGVVGPAAAATP